jgi:hypothetical protein
MVDRPVEMELEFLRERAAKLREIAAQMPPHTASQLLDVAAQLEARAAKFGQHARRGSGGSPDQHSSA